MTQTSRLAERGRPEWGWAELGSGQLSAAQAFPGGRADANALRRQGGSLPGQFLSVESHAPYLSSRPLAVNQVDPASFGEAPGASSRVPGQGGTNLTSGWLPRAGLV